MGTPGLGWRRYDTLEFIGSDEVSFAFVPGGEDFGRGGAAENARVDEAAELDAGDVARCAENAFKVPDGLGSGWSESCQFERERKESDKGKFEEENKKKKKKK